jgi:hypothetical protein
MVLSSERSGRFERKVSLMLRKLRGRYRERENVLVRCYDDPEILERFLEHHRAQRMLRVIGLWAVPSIWFGSRLFSRTDWWRNDDFFFIVLVMILIMGHMQQSELHRVQSLRLMQHLRSKE